MSEQRYEERRISRRRLVFGGIALTASAIAAVGIGRSGIGLPGQAEARTTPLPWPYQKIDPNEAAAIAYEGFHKDLCCYGVSRAIMAPLERTVGEPYISQPLYEGLKLGAAGIAEWGTVCGALLGAMVVTGFITPLETGKQIMNELFQWYSTSPLPVYRPPKSKVDLTVRTVSNSPLCHISVGKWLKAADKAIKGPEQRERCARLTADVAMKTAMLLNDWKDGTFRTNLVLHLDKYGATTQTNCGECHTGTIPVPKK